MSGERDDDALSWAGDNDPTLEAGSAPTPVEEFRTAEELPPAEELPQGWSVVGNPGRDGLLAETASGALTDTDTDSDTETASAASATSLATTEPEPISSGALIALGVVGGILLLYTVGWVISVGRINANFLGTYGGDPLGGFMFLLGGWLAIVAPAIWMCTTLWLTRDGKQRGRILWLVLGIVVLLPWPLLIGR